MSDKDMERNDGFEAIKSNLTSWASEIINVLLDKFAEGKMQLPQGFEMSGISLTDFGDGKVTINFSILQG